MIFHRLPLSLLMLLWPCVSTKAATWNLVPQDSHQVEIEEQADVWNIRTTSNDPFVIGDLNDLQPNQTVLEFEFFSVSGVRDFQVFLGPPFTQSQSCNLSPLPISQGWSTYTAELVDGALTALKNQPTQLRLDFGYQPNVRVQIRNVQLRSRNETEQARQIDLETQKKAKVQTAERLKEAWATDWPHRIDEIGVDTDHIILRGKLPRSIDRKNLRLREIPIWQSLGDPEHGNLLEAPIQFNDDPLAWQATVPRKTTTHDRVHSRWQLIQTNDNGFTSFTPPQYLSFFATTSQKPTVVRPLNQKGLAGVTPRELADALELGATAVTINLMLDSFVSDQDRPGYERIDAPENNPHDPPVYFNPQAFNAYDEVIQWSKQHQIVVTAICLIRSPLRTQKDHSLVHPDCNGGHYAMPNVASSRGVAIYSHVLRRIAQRYHPQPSSRGGISNWIAHNEIDFHTVWTNMGRQPRVIVMDAYFRSMRIIDHCTRQYDPNARVFVSLTHHWNIPDNGMWDQLAPRDVLQSLARSSQTEGDFPWAVAHHPYPPDLFSPVAWGGPGIGDDFDTHRITLQNIDVLDRFLHQPSMLEKDGKTRGLLLSEQGFHTDSYDIQSQRLQAASILFAMDRVRSHPIIESFHYHRLTDAREEGGLMLGLRTLADKNNPIGKKKLAWEAYRDFGTDDEAKLNELRKLHPEQKPE